MDVLLLALGEVGAAAGARGHVEEAVAAEHEARGRPAGTVPPRLGDEQFLDVGEGHALEPAAGERGGGHAVGATLVVGEIDEVILGEARVEHDVHQPRQPLRLHHRHAADRRRVEHAVLQQAQPARPLGDEHAAVGKPGEAPRVGEAAGDDRHLDLVLLRRVEHPRTVAERERAARRSARRRHAVSRPRSPLTPSAPPRRRPAPAWRRSPSRVWSSSSAIPAQRMAMGLPGEPVAPLNFNGAKMYANS